MGPRQARAGSAGVRARIVAALAMLAVIVPAPALSQQGMTRQQDGGQPGAAATEKGAQQKTPSAAAGPPTLAARAWILIDPRDDEVLAARAPARERPIASATKLMTALVALEELRPKQKLTAPPYQALAAESLLGLRAGEKMTTRDLLYALILASANDAAATIAEGVAGSVPRFVNRMNREARALGLDDTSYANPIGLDDPANYSSAADLAELTALLMRDRLFAQIADSQVARLNSGDRPRTITSRNTLLESDPTADGVKTGHTIQAGYVLVGSATRDGTRLISVVLGAGSEAARDAETQKLLDYGFSLYRPASPVKRGEELADPKLDYRDERLSLVAQRPIAVSAREGQAVETEVEAPGEVSGAIDRGEKLGRVVVTVDGRVAGVSPLVASESVEAATLVDKAVTGLQDPVILLPLGAFVIVIGLLLAARSRRSGEGDETEPPPEQTRNPGRPRGPRERTAEERRQMHEERMRRRRQRAGDEGP